MKNGKPLSMLLTVLTLAALAATLGACAPQQQVAGTDDAAASGESFPTGSLEAVHLNGELDGIDEYTNKLCLSCHSREAINEANEDFAGIEGFNPHKSHLEAGECVSCHSVDGTSTLSCNSCHDAPLPDGWESAERGAGPIHSLTAKSS